MWNGFGTEGEPVERSGRKMTGRGPPCQAWIGQSAPIWQIHRVTPPIRVYLDYVDPLFFAAEARAASLEAVGLQVAREPFELCPPPLPLLSAAHPELERRRAEASRRQPERAFPRPSLVPWTRKAHELALHALEKGCFDRVHSALAEAHLSRARDIGRVDVLLEVAGDCGLDWSETKAVLDVDRFATDVEEMRARALRLGVESAPTFVVGDRCFEGIPERDAIRDSMTMPDANSPAEQE